MRIIMFNLLDWSTPGSGSVAHQCGLMQAWQQSGHDVEMLTPCNATRDGVPAHLRDHIQPTFRTQTLGLPVSLSTVFQVPKVIGQRMAHGKAIVFTRANSATFLLVAAARISGMHVVVDHNGWMERERLQAGGNARIARLEGMFQYLAAKWAHKSRCVTAGMAAELQRRGVSPDRLTVIGNGCDTELIQPVARDKALAHFALDEDRFYLGFVGNIVPWHGLDTAIDALAQISKLRPEVDLLIFGDGAAAKDLREQSARLGLADRIHFRGRIAPQEVPKAIGCFDLAIAPLTTLRDTAFGYSAIKIREYAAAGRPVLTGHIPDSTDFLGKGWLFTHQADDAADMAARLEQLLADRDALLKAGALARDYAENHFDWARIADKIADACFPED